MWKGLGSLLAQNPARSAVVRGAQTALSVEDAERVLFDVFPKLASQAKVESYANGIVVVRVMTSIGMQEVTLRKDPIMRALASRGMPVRDLRVRMHFERQSEYENV